MRLADYSLHVREVGTDVPVLLIHEALGSTAAYFDPERGALAEAIAARGCRVVAFDLPGHGLSDAVPGGLPPDFVERCAVDAVEVLDAVHGGQTGAVIGVGFGGLVALRLAAMLPRRFNCAIADSPPGLMPGGAVEPFTLADKRGEPKRPNLVAAWQTFAERLAGEDPYQRLRGTMQCPVLITFCGSSDSTEAARVYRLAREFPAQVAILPGEVPPASWNAPGFFLREVERFLAAYA